LDFYIREKKKLKKIFKNFNFFFRINLKKNQMKNFLIDIKINFYFKKFKKIYNTNDENRSTLIFFLKQNFSTKKKKKFPKIKSGMYHNYIFLNSFLKKNKIKNKKK
jgi:hypothetical protein